MRTMNATLLRPRPARTVPASICAAVLIVIGAAAAAAGVARLADGRTPTVVGRIADQLGRLTWHDPAVLAGAALAVIAGLILVLAAIIPGRRSNLPVWAASAAGAPVSDADGRPATAAEPGETVITPRTVEQLVTARLRQVDGVDRLSVRVAGRRITVLASTPGRDTAALSDRLRTAATSAVEQSGLGSGPTVRVAVRRQLD